MQERRNSIANALELRRSYINPSISKHNKVQTMYKILGLTVQAYSFSFEIIKDKNLTPTHNQVICYLD